MSYVNVADNSQYLHFTPIPASTFPATKDVTYRVAFKMASTPTSTNKYTILDIGQNTSSLKISIQVRWDRAMRIYVEGTEFITTTLASASAWNEVFLTTDGDSAVDNIKVYVNGTKETFSKDLSVHAPHAFSHMAVGRYHYFASQHFDGSIDNISFWNVTFTDAEVTAASGILGPDYTAKSANLIDTLPLEANAISTENAWSFTLEPSGGTVGTFDSNDKSYSGSQPQTNTEEGYVSLTPASSEYLLSTVYTENSGTNPFSGKFTFPLTFRASVYPTAAPAAGEYGTILALNRHISVTHSLLLAIDENLHPVVAVWTNNTAEFQVANTLTLSLNAWNELVFVFTDQENCTVYLGDNVTSQALTIPLKNYRDYLITAISYGAVYADSTPGKFFSGRLSNIAGWQTDLPLSGTDLFDNTPPKYVYDNGDPFLFYSRLKGTYPVSGSLETEFTAPNGVTANSTTDGPPLVLLEATENQSSGSLSAILADALGLTMDRFLVIYGTSSNILHVGLRDSTTGQLKTGLLYSDITAKVHRDGAVSVLTTQDITSLNTYEAPTNDVSIRIKETSDAGMYEIHIHDSWVNSASDGFNIKITLKAAGTIDKDIHIQLVSRLLSENISSWNSTSPPPNVGTSPYAALELFLSLQTHEIRAEAGRIVLRNRNNDADLLEWPLDGTVENQVTVGELQAVTP